ncbi:DNA alkylation repair protein [Flavobacterium cerinum]|uniref:DNA alkylation repair protein n=1 Tax=Flavobacterium cerinum TaxID=2502784 RepID=A0ABY5ISB1_9FLAO|nr:DNA alkylation repair protein [Flavobacterium cerinum]UUC44346.1 DNA alkylation repair protein [Flavobacterium cerinum]
MTVRKGARTIAEIPPEIRDQLNNGLIESANLNEWLAINQKQLLEKVLIALNRKEYLNDILTDIANLKKQTVTQINEMIGVSLLTQSYIYNDTGLFEKLSVHPSDTVRCWATYFIGKSDRPLAEKLERMQPFAADNHFGVREISWIALRADITENLEQAIVLLTPWTLSDNEYIRRFASESIRPRGVWCKHIEALKETPETGSNILEPLKSDSSKYVRDSVANWLNDASKTRPDFVVNLCKKWEKESPTKETAYIIKRALRSINR